LFNELPEATREIDAVATLAFNVSPPQSRSVYFIHPYSHMQILAFSNNNLLRLLSVLSIASVPVALACAILSIDFEDKKLTGQE